MHYRKNVHGWCFFFSSRRRHTRLQGDWSSDVCSSDLNVRLNGGDARNALEPLQNARSLYAETEIRISTDHAETLVALGRAQLALGDMNAAAQSLAMADKFWQAFDPGNRHAGLAKLYLAQATWERGDKSGAAQALRQADAVLDRSVFPAD